MAKEKKDPAVVMCENMGDVRKAELVSVRHYRKWGYVVKSLRLTYPGLTSKAKAKSGTIPFRMAFTPEGHYIGNPRDAYLLCKTKGIKPELAAPKNSVCTIGRSGRKWYGWSHRAIHGFGIGHVVREGSACCESLPVGFKARDMEECRQMAVAFAESVS